MPSGSAASTSMRCSINSTHGRPITALDGVDQSLVAARGPHTRGRQSGRQTPRGESFRGHGQVVTSLWRCLNTQLRVGRAERTHTHIMTQIMDPAEPIRQAARKTMEPIGPDASREWRRLRWPFGRRRRGWPARPTSATCSPNIRSRPGHRRTGFRPGRSGRRPRTKTAISGSRQTPACTVSMAPGSSGGRPPAEATIPSLSVRAVHVSADGSIWAGHGEGRRHQPHPSRTGSQLR